MFKCNDVLSGFSHVSKFRKSEGSLCVLTEAAFDCTKFLVFIVATLKRLVNIAFP